jgi:hypothetical protein
MQQPPEQAPTTILTTATNQVRIQQATAATIMRAVN